MLRAAAGWWDGIELWLTQLPFALQVVLVVGVVAPVCWVLSALIDTLVERFVAARLGAVERRSTSDDVREDEVPDGPVDGVADTAPAQRARPGRSRAGR